MTYAEYVAAEAASDVRHEFVDGEMFAMSGGHPLPGLLAARFIVALGPSLGQGPCRSYCSDTRIFVPDLAVGLYPDLSVICGQFEQDSRDPQGVTNPTVVVEVLSPTTELWDRNGKFDRYRHLACLRDYVLVTQERNRVEHFARNDDGSWTYRDLRDGDVLRLTGAPAEVAITGLYDGVVELRQDPGAEGVPA